MLGCVCNKFDDSYCHLIFLFVIKFSIFSDYIVSSFISIILFTFLDLKVYSCSIFLFYISLKNIHQINVTITSTNQRQQTKVEGNKGIEHNRVFPQYTKLATLTFFVQLLMEINWKQ